MSILEFGEYMLLAWTVVLFSFIAIVSVKILNGEINTAGLLSNSSGEQRAPERVLIVGVSMLILLSYVLEVAQTGAIEVSPSKFVMPDAPDFLVQLLMAANGIYLGGKVIRNRM